MPRQTSGKTAKGRKTPKAEVEKSTEAPTPFTVPGRYIANTAPKVVKAKKVRTFEEAKADPNQVIRAGWSEKAPDANLYRVRLLFYLKHRLTFTWKGQTRQTIDSLPDLARSMVEAVEKDLEAHPEKGPIVGIRVQLMRYADLPKGDRLEDDFGLPDLPPDEDLFGMER